MTPRSIFILPTFKYKCLVANNLVYGENTTYYLIINTLRVKYHVDTNPSND